MRLPELHARVHCAVIEAGDGYGLLIAGGYAMRAHGLVDRPSKDLDFATAHAAALPEIAETIAEGCRRRGFDVAVGETTLRMVRMVLTDRTTGEACEVDLLKEALQGRPYVTAEYRVVSLDDAVGLKVRALADRGVPRDFIDVTAVADQYGFRELERLARLHDEEFTLSDLALRLGAVDLIPDWSFASYGLSDSQIQRVRTFAYVWEQDIAQRREEDGDLDTDRDPAPDFGELLD